MKKGLRRLARLQPARAVALKHCPDEEGIKTSAPGTDARWGGPLKHCPDEEGIKTSQGQRTRCPIPPSKTLP